MAKSMFDELFEEKKAPEPETIELQPNEKRVIEALGKEFMVPLKRLKEGLDAVKESVGELEKAKAEGKIDAADETYVKLTTEVDNLKQQVAQRLLEEGRDLGAYGIGTDGNQFKTLGRHIVDQKFEEEFKGKRGVTVGINVAAFMGHKNNPLRQPLVELTAKGEEVLALQSKATSVQMRDLSVSRFFADGVTRINPLTNFTTIDILREPLRIEQLIKVVPTTQDAVQYIEATLFDNLRTHLAANSPSGATTLTLDNVGGFFVNQPITVKTNTVTHATRVTGVDKNASQITIGNALPAAASSGQPVVSQVFAGTPEGVLKPLMGLRQPTLKQSNIITIAHAIHVPRQMLADLPRIESEINTSLLAGLDTNREYHLLYGTGGAEMLGGILNHPGRQVYNQTTVNFGNEDDGHMYQSRIDAIRRAATLTYAAYMPATTVIVNPFDWQEIELLKDKELRYIWTSVTDGGVERLWRLPITIAQTLQPGTVLMGDFTRGCTLHNREQGNIRMTDSHAGTFLENIITILAEERVGFTVERPQAFVEVKLDAPFNQQQ